MTHAWLVSDLVATAIEGVAAEAARLDRDQSWSGIDAYDELAWHAVLESALFDAGHGVFRETLYPGQRNLRRLPRDRERCDLVLTPGPDQDIADVEEARRLADRAAGGGLFADVARESADADTADKVPPEDCCWIEVKAVAQTTYRDGAPGPNTRYTSELVATTKDLRKLARNEHILHGWLLVLLFTRDEATARHDLRVMTDRANEKGIGVADSIVETLPIADRVGNAVAGLGFFRAPLNA